MPKRRGKATTESTPPKPADPHPRLGLVAAAAGAPGPGLKQKASIAANLNGRKTTLVAPDAKSVDLPALTGMMTTEAQNSAAVVAADTSAATSWGVSGRRKETMKAGRVEIPVRAHGVTAKLATDTRTRVRVPGRTAVKLSTDTGAAKGVSGERDAVEMGVGREDLIVAEIVTKPSVAVPTGVEKGQTRPSRRKREKNIRREWPLTTTPKRGWWTAGYRCHPVARIFLPPTATGEVQMSHARARVRARVRGTRI